MARTKARLGTAAALAAVAALGATANGCYYAHVVGGQARVLLGRESIESVLAREDGGLLAEERAMLALVPEIRRFAIERLGLADTGSYTSFYDTGGKPVSWNLTASKRTSFSPFLWTFPFVGAAPYKGFFDKEEALAAAVALEADGWDAHVRPVAAYSTLGWFEDPVFRGMLSRGVADLANTIIHEMAHATVFRPGDAEFNESLASFIGDRGAEEFLEVRFGKDSPEVRAARDEAHDQRLFVGFMESLHARLDRLYRGPLSEAEKLARREEIFAAARTEFEELRRARFKTDGYAGFAKRKLNNAVLIGFKAYHTDAGAFEDVLELCGRDWRRAVAVFRAAAEEACPKSWLAMWRVRERDKRGYVARPAAGEDGAALTRQP